MDWIETRDFLSPFFPEDVRSELDMLLPGELREIRIRAERPTVFVTATRTAALPWAPDQQQLEALLEAMSEHSLYTRSNEINQGYLTLRGGHRVGLCGHVSVADHQSVLSHIGSVCIRIAAEWPGSSAPLMPYMNDAGNSLLVIGPPGSGKTTLLRDLAQQLASGRNAIQLSIVDERSEIAACVNGVPQLHVGLSSDVLDGLPKSIAIPWLVRSLSPKVIITDELIGEQETSVILDAVSSGISICASVHGTSLQDAARRPPIAAMMSHRIFGMYAVLSSADSGHISALYDRTGNLIKRS